MSDEVAIAFEQYRPAARAAARTLCPVASQVDRMGNTREDYEALFAWRASQAAVGFRERQGFCGPAEARYVGRSISNAKTSTARNYQRRVSGGVQFLSWESDPLPEEIPAITYDVQSQLEARSVLRWLQSRLTEAEWSTLTAVAEYAMGDGWGYGTFRRMAEAHPEWGCNRTQLKHRYQHLREKARTLIEKKIDKRVR